ncbi:lysine histidine transporter-like 8 isoform X1 [Selaginella moellendorffii]|nr:lysine histidine transporter-like 8 isoform X1 [Selaginella moellendorffii]|eukprot:XP_002973261.2 lysine histidine transporter-like 8 isoform X1 [Selaginella moellendorffii]
MGEDGGKFSSFAMEREPEVSSLPSTPQNNHSIPPSVARSPRRMMLSPMGTPMRKAFGNMKCYLEEIGHIAKLNPQDAWLPITESRNGNAYYSAFHNLNAGIGFQCLLLPVAFSFLGWFWGVLALVVAFLWQLYTLWILIKLHEVIPGRRYNRYIELAQAAFGERLGSWLTSFPIISLSAGTAGGLIAIGGSTLHLFYNLVCIKCHGQSLTAIEWYLVFAVLCAIIAQLPNLNSVAGVSLIGAVMAVAYSTMIWILSVTRDRPPGVSYDVAKPYSSVGAAFSFLNALGVIAFAFRGHNLALEIQATMPSTLKHPAYVPMWRGSKAAYTLVAICYFPLAIGGYWAYGKLMLPTGILTSMFVFHRSDISPAWLATCFLFVVVSSLSNFQIYSMPTFDLVEQTYTANTNKPCPKLHRFVFRLLFVFFGFFVGIAFPFMASFGGLLGGVCSVPVTFCYPCFMWLKIKKPPKLSFSWYLNWTLGILSVVFTIVVTIGGIWSIVDTGLKFQFFKPQ